ncbi:hypothetical protein DPMN_112988 [Dreissena polymorpha]|uniref:Uncharacterized protein n=1 Tax=Dreissena polymorpha TaxID=45954 RepID=A0A9D4KH48_DREPO|nr:hypothetical protein DPMN_112988 [Dreissena polymorpha]
MYSARLSSSSLSLRPTKTSIKASDLAGTVTFSATMTFLLRDSTAFLKHGISTQPRTTPLLYSKSAGPCPLPTKTSYPSNVWSSISATTASHCSSTLPKQRFNLAVPQTRMGEPQAPINGALLFNTGLLHSGIWLYTLCAIIVLDEPVSAVKAIGTPSTEPRKYTPLPYLRSKSLCQVLASCYVLII